MTIAYVPADLPKIPYSEQECWDFFNENNAEKEYWDMFEKNKSPGSSKIWDFYIMRETNLSDEERACISGGHESCKYDDKIWWWKEEAKLGMPKLIDFIEALPLRKLTHTSMLSNIRFVTPHQDFDLQPWNHTGIEKFREEAEGLEPVLYRLLLAGNRTDSFYVSPTDDVEDAVCITLPEETDTFLINSTSFYHGAYATEPRKLLCFVSGFIDAENHKKLLDSSIEKYSDYIIDF